MHPRTGLRKSYIYMLILTAYLLLFTPHVAGYPDYVYSGEFINVPRLGWPIKIPVNYTMPGDVLTYNYTLEGGHTYHAYLIGEFVNLTTHETDYDVFLYRETPTGYRYLSSNTEAAGYPEQISNDGKGQYFTPSVSGNYYFAVRNDPVESNSSEEALLMVVEHIQLNEWYSKYLQEPDEYGEPRYDTCWVYEFRSSDPLLKIEVEVPGTLDMYEARLYIMGHPSKDVGLTINGVPAPWWPGLNGTLDGVYGGSNDDPQGFRHLNMSDSCETGGEDMLIDYSPKLKGELLYHLVLLPEYGNGTVRVRAQTDFSLPVLTLVDPVDEVNSGEETPVMCRIQDRSPLSSVTLQYTVDGRNWSDASYTSVGEYYNGTIPGLGPGTVATYKWVAVDSLGNSASISSQFKAMMSTSIKVSIDKERVRGGDVVIMSGEMNLPNVKLQVRYVNDGVTTFEVTTDKDGMFSHVLAPNKLGAWEVYAEYGGDASYRSSVSDVKTFTVERKPTSVTLNISEPVIGLGSSVNLTGRFSEARVGYEVVINAKSSINQTTLVTLTDNDGFYRTVFTPGAQGEWTLQAVVGADGIYTDGARSTFEKLQVAGPTIAKRIDTMKSTAMKPPYVYALGAILGGSVGGGLYLARKRGLIFKKKEAEPVPDESADEDDFDFEL